MPLTLFLDLASNVQSLALVTPERALAMHTAEPRFDERQLMPAIETMLAEHQSSLKNLDRIACVIGPGGFMSLRVGVSLANALAYSLNIPIAGIHLSDMWHQRVGRTDHSSLTTDHFLWLHSTKRTHLFIRGFGELANRWPEAALIPNAELESIEAGTVIIGELIEEHAALTRHCSRLTELAPIELVLPSLLQSLQYDTKQLAPWYGREA